MSKDKPKGWRRFFSEGGVIATIVVGIVVDVINNSPVFSWLWETFSEFGSWLLQDSHTPRVLISLLGLALFATVYEAWYRLGMRARKIVVLALEVESLRDMLHHARNPPESDQPVLTDTEHRGIMTLADYINAIGYPTEEDLEEPLRFSTLQVRRLVGRLTKLGLIEAGKTDDFQPMVDLTDAGMDYVDNLENRERWEIMKDKLVGAEMAAKWS